MSLVRAKWAVKEVIQPAVIHAPMTKPKDMRRVAWFIGTVVARPSGYRFALLDAFGVAGTTAARSQIAHRRVGPAGGTVLSRRVPSAPPPKRQYREQDTRYDQTTSDSMPASGCGPC